jgi:hypothetical protein
MIFTAQQLHPHTNNLLGTLNMRQGVFQSWFRHPNLNLPAFISAASQYVKLPQLLCLA